MSEPPTLSLGQRVRVRDAFGNWHDATIARVPADWRDGMGHVTTTRGAFPKAWVTIDGYDGQIPWPLDDIEGSPRA